MKKLIQGIVILGRGLRRRAAIFSLSSLSGRGPTLFLLPARIAGCAQSLCFDGAGRPVCIAKYWESHPSCFFRSAGYERPGGDRVFDLFSKYRRYRHLRSFWSGAVRPWRVVSHQRLSPHCPLAQAWGSGAGSRPEGGCPQSGALRA